MSRAFVFLILITLSKFASALTSDGQSVTSPVVIQNTLDVPMTSNCSIVETPVPPFYVAKSNLSTQGSPAGTIGANSLVQLDTNNPDAAALTRQNLMSVQILSAAGGTNQNMVGQHVHVSSSSLLTATTGVLGALGAPGSFINFDPQKYIFVVRRDSPFFNIPELRGKAVRLAQDSPHIYPPMSANYFVKRCCATPPVPTTEDAKYSRYTPKPYELKPNPQCTYQPIFEVLNDTGSAGSPNYIFNNTFAVPTADTACRAFEGALTPLGADSYHSLQTAASQAIRYSQDTMNKMRNYFAQETRKTGNHSEGTCRAAVRRVMVKMGYLSPDDRPPSDTKKWHPASGFYPWLATKGFKDVKGQYNTSSMPIGCTAVYGGAGAGHTETRLEEHRWTSDYDANHPRDTDPRRPLLAIYCPPGVS